MKQLLFGLLFISMSAVLSAQSGTPEQKATGMTELFAKKFQLSSAQETKMYQIQLRRFRDRDLITPNKTSDQPLYLEQLKAIEYGADISIQLMLAESQLPQYQAYSVERREKRAVLAGELLSKGTSIGQVEMAILEME